MTAPALPDAARAELRVLTCGSVDDGKSTLVGRLLHDSKRIFTDQLAALEADSRRHGTAGEALDLALLVDGLQAEREQGITIDLAYRFFSTPRRSFIAIDAPGHEQYTRNMATGASQCDLAIILVDARKGVVTQTRRHAAIVALMGVRRVVLAVNKMDLVGWSEPVFRAIEAAFGAVAGRLGIVDVAAFPISAREGDNVVERSGSAPWHDGPALLPFLETVDIADRDADGPFRMPVQLALRPDADFRGYAGTVAMGRVAVGDEVVNARTGRLARVAQILAPGGDAAEARAGDAVVLRMAEEVDIARGDVLAAPGARPELSDQFAARILWAGEESLIPGRRYLLKLATQTVAASVTSLKHRLDLDTLEPSPARTLAFNEIGVANLSTSAPVAFDAYAQNRTTGGFVLIDRETKRTLGAGMIEFGLRRATNLAWQPHTIDKAARAASLGQKPAIVWFTGLSGSGKSTIADLVERKLHAAGAHTYLLDGDNVRHGLNRDLGFTDAERVENIRRVAEVAKLFADAGLVVLVAFISPFRSERRMARDLAEAGEFLEVFVDTPLEVCRARDPKGLYAKVDKGLVRNFTGVDSPYETPETPELRLDTVADDAATLADRVVEELRRRGRLDP